MYCNMVSVADQDVDITPVLKPLIMIDHDNCMALHMLSECVSEPGRSTLYLSTSVLKYNL